MHLSMTLVGVALDVVARNLLACFMNVGVFANGLVLMNFLLLSLWLRCLVRWGVIRSIPRLVWILAPGSNRLFELLMVMVRLVVMRLNILVDKNRRLKCDLGVAVTLVLTHDHSLVGIL